MKQITTTNAADFAVSYLDAMEARDMESARAHVGDTIDITFPGGRNFRDIEQIVKNSGGRYKLIKKNIQRRDVWQDGDRICVLISGLLYGEWANGTPFEGIRFTDRIEITGGRISKQEVWNDTGERLLALQKEAAE
ncbi:nuclear transport factor 2 family protein [Hoeflea alexandrii]|uniref:nuclear transport factor 2 family protein n=1 Tax=Hoeflea alexandrii TaxID=288436 RepID=UPI0035D07973